MRHGETEWALSGRHTGRTDLALTAHGEEQAALLKPALHGVTFDRVFTSPAVRARRTCELAGLADAAEIEPDLAEWDYGDYEGLLSTDIQASRPGWAIYRDGCPGGEGTGQVADRADRLIDRLQTIGGTIALFSHGQIGCSLVVRWIGLPIIEGRHFMLKTASLSVLGYNPSHPGLRVIASLNSRG